MAQYKEGLQGSHPIQDLAFTITRATCYKLLEA